jgi:hypothetical protein
MVRTACLATKFGMALVIELDVFFVPVSLTLTNFTLPFA